jgi:hypothetical protein
MLTVPRDNYFMLPTLVRNLALCTPTRSSIKGTELLKGLSSRMVWAESSMNRKDSLKGRESEIFS